MTEPAPVQPAAEPCKHDAVYPASPYSHTHMVCACGRRVVSRLTGKALKKYRGRVFMYSHDRGGSWIALPLKMLDVVDTQSAAEEDECRSVEVSTTDCYEAPRASLSLTVGRCIARTAWYTLMSIAALAFLSISLSIVTYSQTL